MRDGLRSQREPGQPGAGGQGFLRARPARPGLARRVRRATGSASSAATEPGKTTLLAALAGTVDLDAGRATRAGGATVGYLPQAEELAGPVGEAVFGSLAEHEWAADAARSSGRRGAAWRHRPQRRRPRSCPAASAAGPRWPRCCCGSYDLLLLDEPTNHLDIEAISWLAGYLREHATSFVVVTHDRWFLDAVTEETWELADGQVHAYDGGYSAYVLARAERARVAAAADQRRRNLLSQGARLAAARAAGPN